MYAAERPKKLILRTVQSASWLVIVKDESSLVKEHVWGPVSAVAVIINVSIAFETKWCCPYPHFSALRDYPNIVSST